MSTFYDAIATAKRVGAVIDRNKANVPTVNIGNEMQNIRNDFALNSLNDAWELGLAEYAFNGDWINMYCGM